MKHLPPKYAAASDGMLMLSFLSIATVVASRVFYADEHSIGWPWHLLFLVAVCGFVCFSIRLFGGFIDNPDDYGPTPMGATRIGNDANERNRNGE